jgi:hypothetical protein
MERTTWQEPSFLVQGQASVEYERPPRLFVAESQVRLLGKTKSSAQRTVCHPYIPPTLTVHGRVWPGKYGPSVDAELERVVGLGFDELERLHDRIFLLCRKYAENKRHLLVPALLACCHDAVQQLHDYVIAQQKPATIVEEQVMHFVMRPLHHMAPQLVTTLAQDDDAMEGTNDAFGAEGFGGLRQVAREQPMATHAGTVMSYADCVSRRVRCPGGSALSVASCGVGRKARGVGRHSVSPTHTIL